MLHLFFVPESPGERREVKATWRRGVRVLAWLGAVALVTLAIACAHTLIDCATEPSVHAPR